MPLSPNHVFPRRETQPPPAGWQRSTSRVPHPRMGTAAHREKTPDLRPHPSSRKPHEPRLSSKPAVVAILSPHRQIRNDDRTLITLPPMSTIVGHPRQCGTRPHPAHARLFVGWGARLLFPPPPPLFFRFFFFV